jgi:hypothetical protein
MRRLLTILTALIILPAYGRPAPTVGPLADGGPNVAFDGKNISVSGAAKNDILYAGGLEIRGGPVGLAVESHVATAIAAADGSAQLDMASHITVRSIWIVVDGTGGYTISPGPGMVKRQMELNGNPGVAGGDGQVRQIALKRSDAFVFLVRPGVGLWRDNMIDGYKNDDDKTTNGSLKGRLQDLKPDAGTTAPPPDHLMPGDVLFIVDPFSLEFAVMRQGK